jgi:uncharacterized membrane protein YkoI
MKKFATMLLALLLMTATALGESSIPAEVAKLVPETVSLIETDREDGLMEYEFRDGEMFYEVVTKKGTPIALTTRNAAVKPSKENLLTEEQALSGLVGEKLHARAEKDDGRWVWKVILREENDLVEYELNAETGEVIETERYFAADIGEIPEKLKKPDLELEDGKLRWDKD